MPVYPVEVLKKYSIDLFLKMDCSLDHSKRAADVLVSADLRGIDSHGVARLSSYVRNWENGRINTSPIITIDHETPSTAVVNGDSGLGLVVGPHAMKIAIEKAAQVGTGWVAVKNSNHYGIAAYHTMMALEHDMIGISMTNASPLVVPTFSQESMLGTNPLSVTFPAGNEKPFVADFATTAAAYGKLEILQRKDEPAPSGWVQDSTGKPSNDPHAVPKGGALLPLGSDRVRGGHKGYCLGAIVDIFSAVLSGANYGPWVPPYVAFLDSANERVGDGVGHFFGALRVDAFRPADEFKKNMDKWLRRFRNAAPVAGEDQVLVPGDPERECEKRRLREGIPLHGSVADDLKALAERFSISF